MLFAGMGDHVRIGPQYEVPTHRGVPVIQRGPHGKHIAPELAAAGQGQGKRPGDLMWWGDFVQPTMSVPRQVITGVSGMGLLDEPGVMRKRALASQASDLKNQALSCSRLDCPAMQAAIKGFRAAIRQYPRWGVGFMGVYGSWQSIDITAQQAEVIVARKLANRPIPKGAIETVPKEGMAPHLLPSLAEATAETALAIKNMPAEWVKNAEDAVQRNMKYQVVILGVAIVAVGFVAASYGAGQGIGQRIAGGGR